MLIEHVPNLHLIGI